MVVGVGYMDINVLSPSPRFLWDSRTTTKLIHDSGSKLGTILPHSGYLAMSGDVFATTVGVGNCWHLVGKVWA